MKTIWKFPLQTTDHQIIEMPKGHIILGHVQVQFGVPCFWAEVDPDKEKIKEEFRIVGTGHDLCDINPSEWFFMGTYQVSGGQLVFHVFKKHNPQPTQ